MNSATLDQGWVELMMEARDLGLKVEEVREFFENYEERKKSISTTETNNKREKTS